MIRAAGGKGGRASCWTLYVKFITITILPYLLCLVPLVCSVVGNAEANALRLYNVKFQRTTVGDCAP